MRGLICSILTFLTLGSVLSAEDDLLDKIFQANEEQILRTPVMELGGYVFYSGRVHPSSISMSSKSIAQAMARSKAESNVWLLKSRQISYKGTILEGRTILQGIVFNAWRALGHKANYTINNSLVVFSGMKDGLCCFVAAVKPENIIFQDREPLSFERMRRDILADVARRNELIAYELLEESEINASRAKIAACLEKKINRNFSRMFLRQEPKTPLPRGVEYARKKLASLGEDAPLDELLKLTSNLPYDKELCQRLANAFQKREMLRCAAWMDKLVADYDELKKEWIKAKPAPVPAPAPTPAAQPAEKPAPSTAPAETPAAAPAEKSAAATAPAAKSAAVTAPAEKSATQPAPAGKPAATSAEKPAPAATSAEKPAPATAPAATSATQPAPAEKPAPVTTSTTQPAPAAPPTPPEDKVPNQVAIPATNRKPVVHGDSTAMPVEAKDSKVSTPELMPDAAALTQAAKKKKTVLSAKDQAIVDQIMSPIPGTMSQKEGKSPNQVAVPATNHKPVVHGDSTAAPVAAKDSKVSTPELMPDAAALTQAAKKKKTVLSAKDQAIVDQILSPIPGALPQKTDAKTVQKTTPP